MLLSRDESWWTQGDYKLRYRVLLHYDATPHNIARIMTMIDGTQIWPNFNRKMSLASIWKPGVEIRWPFFSTIWFLILVRRYLYIELGTSICTLPPGKGYYDPSDVGLVYLIPRVSCQKGPTRHAYAWQIGPFWNIPSILHNIRTLSSQCLYASQC